ncbi:MULTISPECIES: DUF6035 family protein [Pseudomonas]|uniref:DUF6035 family protein n=1 Tax=Pseudomonas TaxID=286 RepID=UPI00156B4B14|nr:MULTISPECIES: DUF6035 family protein [Pseudomonas]
MIADRSCGEPQVEKVWKGQAVAERATWRKPDVRVARGDERIAFEVQLSTTFLTEIVGRREFYQANGGSMIWVFQNFDPSSTKTAEEDIFFLNHLTNQHLPIPGWRGRRRYPDVIHSFRKEQNPLCDVDPGDLQEDPLHSKAHAVA